MRLQAIPDLDQAHPVEPLPHTRAATYGWMLRVLRRSNRDLNAALDRWWSSRPSRRASSSSVLLSAADYKALSEAWPPGSAATAPAVPEATPEDSTPPPDPYFAKVIGAAEWSRYVPAGALWPSVSSTGAPARPASSTSTPTPSYVSRRSVVDSSR